LPSAAPICGKNREKFPTGSFETACQASSG
jgi:hypothetical protein